MTALEIAIQILNELYEESCHTEATSPRIPTLTYSLKMAEMCLTKKEIEEYTVVLEKIQREFATYLEFLFKNEFKEGYDHYPNTIIPYFPEYVTPIRQLAWLEGWHQAQDMRYSNES